MFGYVTINKPELRIREYEKYQASYCGLCHSLKESFGLIGQMTLTYDMTFLVLFLNSLYEPEETVKKSRCIVHPVKKRTIVTTEYTKYAAEINIALTYHKLYDDWLDEKDIKSLAIANTLKNKYNKIAKKYKRQCDAIESNLKKLHEYEKQQEYDIDKVSGCFGSLMSEIFLYKSGPFDSTIRRFAFYLGKFIYIIDAYEDIEKDLKENAYNPFSLKYADDDFDSYVQNILIIMMSDCAKEFEILPLVSDVEILRNIIYAGVFTKFNQLYKDKLERKKQK